MAGVFDALMSEIAMVPCTTRVGRVAEIARGTVRVTGLEGVATLGDRVQIGAGMGGEIVALRNDSVTILTDALSEGPVRFHYPALSVEADFGPDADAVQQQKQVGVTR